MQVFSATVWNTGKACVIYNRPGNTDIIRTVSSIIEEALLGLGYVVRNGTGLLLNVNVMQRRRPVVSGRVSCAVGPIGDESQWRARFVAVFVDAVGVDGENFDQARLGRVGKKFPSYVRDDLVTVLTPAMDDGDAQGDEDDNSEHKEGFLRGKQHRK